MKSLFLFLFITLISGCATTTTNHPTSHGMKWPKTDVEWLQEDLAACKLAVKECPASMRECEENIKTGIAPFHKHPLFYCEEMEIECLKTEAELLTALSKEEK